jgi:hypothetical protein
MRSLILSLVLGIAALGFVAATPSPAQARPWWGWRSSYYYPGSYYTEVTRIFPATYR